MRVPRLLTVSGIVFAGLAAAWPFRQREPLLVDPPVAAVPLELTLHRADVSPLSQVGAVSPAVGLSTEPAQFSQTSLHLPEVSRSHERVVDLENLAPPPELPVRFQPPLDAAELESSASVWQPYTIAPPQRLAPAPRAKTYRLRDGDTLETLAERLLGSRERAAEIYDANREVLSRPDLLPVGQVLTIPPRDM